MAGREMAVTRRNIVMKEIEMKKNRRHMSLLIALILAAGLIKGTRCAAEDYDMQGWGINDTYNKYYNVTRYEKIRAWVVGFKTEPPMPGMSPGTIMIVRQSGRLIDVHICPTWFAKPADVGVKKGDRVKIKGSRAEIGGKEVFMASKLKKENYFEFKVRLTSSGKPFWTMTPEELVSEKLSENE
jgi:hypothetical protein